MVLRAPDANTEGGSSESSDANRETSSAPQNDANNEQAAVDEIVQQQMKQGQETSTETPEEEVETQETETQQTETTTEQTAPPPLVDKEEDAQLEFHQHPRFQELIKEKNTAKQEAEQLRPQAQRAQILDSFCQQNGIQAQELENALQYLRLRRSNPEQAYQLVKRDYEQLAQYAGDILPPDLQAEVGAGTISPERAREIARGRMMQQHQQWTQQSFTQQQQQTHDQMIQGAINTWASSIRGRDTMFQPKGAPNAVDGKWEYVDMKLSQLRMANPPQTMEQAIKLCEQAYADANRFFSAVLPKPRNLKAPLKSTSAAASTTNAVVKTEKDVVKAILRGQKPHELRYS